MEQKNQKKVLDLRITSFEWGATNSHNPEQDTCHWQSMCYETPLSFNISLREIISESNSLTNMKKNDKMVPCRFYKSLGPFNMLNVIGCSETVFYKSGLTKSLTVCNFRNKVAMRIIFFFKMFKI